MRRLYYKMRQLLQHETFITKCAGKDHLDFGYILYEVVIYPFTKNWKLV